MAKSNREINLESAVRCALGIKELWMPGTDRWPVGRGYGDEARALVSMRNLLESSLKETNHNQETP